MRLRRGSCEIDVGALRIASIELHILEWKGLAIFVNALEPMLGSSRLGYANLYVQDLPSYIVHQQLGLIAPNSRGCSYMPHPSMSHSPILICR